MSNKEKVTEQQEKKVMTKYDLKQQKREEAKAKAKKQKNMEKAIWVIIILAFLAFLASFPIRNAMAVKETFVKINGEDISKIEFDYNYNVVKNNYLNTYGSYLSMFGLDITADLSTQMYSDTLTWEDYFEQQAMDSIVRGKALEAEAKAAGFTYDDTEDYQAYVDGIKAAAEAAGITTKSYVKQAYGEYATLDRIENLIKESLYVNAYYTKLTEDMMPSDEEIQTLYESDKTAYDSVDYYQVVIEAEIPTEPTELADPVEETAEETTEETAYQPSEAEIEKAMADAKVLADAAVDTVTTEGELKENAKYSGTSGVIRDWLYDESRQEGDTTVIEATGSNEYYVISFVKRYLDETPSVDARIITAEADGAQAILDEWKSGEATEDSFAALADQYNEGTTFTAEGGLYEAITATGTLEVVADWLFTEGRMAGDAGSVTTEDGAASYALYYVGPNEPEWKLDAIAVLLNEDLEAHMQELIKDAEIDDFDGNLEYLTVQAAEEAAASETTAE